MSFLTRLELRNYKAFEHPATLEVAPLTIVIGRNNSGKSALVRALLFATQVLREGARQPFPLEVQGVRFGDDLGDCVFDRSPSGFELTLGFDEPPHRLVVGATVLPEKRNRGVVVRFGLGQGPSAVLLESTTEGPVPWEEARALLSAYALKGVPEAIRRIGDGRRSPRPDARENWSPELGVGHDGGFMLEVLADAWARRDDEALERFRDWFRDTLGVTPVLDQTSNEPRLRVDAGLRTPLPPEQVGAGFNEILPVVAELLLVPEPHQPSVLILEHPELHLHPGAHGEVGDLLVDAALRHPRRRLVVECHSDPLLLRVRAAIAERRLRPDQVCLVFVDDGHGEDKVRRIELDDRGTPAFWPSGGIFAEPGAEYARIRRALEARDRSS